MYTPVARQISSFGFVARQPNQLTGILKSPYESIDPANAYFINFIHQQEVYFACCYGNMDFNSIALGSQRPWYVQPCLCDWVIKGLGMSSRVCATG